MENDETTQAREALESINATRSGLADRLITPWWYYPILGTLMAGMALVYGLEQTRDSDVRLLFALVVIFGSLGLATLYSKRTGVTITKPLGPRSKRFFAVFCTLLVLPLLAVLIVEPSQAVTIAVAVFLLVATVLGGRGYDASLRADLRGGTQRKSPGDTR